MKQRRHGSDCLRSPLFDDLPTRCQQLKKGYGECKRGMIDMRKRFRGNQTMAVGKEFSSDKGGQLYSGGRAVKETSIQGLEMELVEGVDGQWRTQQ